MGGLSLDHPWALAFGILGNLVSFMVYLAPIPTFYRVHKKKSTEGFQSEPYVVALFSAMLWIYYAWVKTDQYLLITINSFGCVVETVYIVMFLVYAARKVRVHAVKLILALNVVLFGSIVLSTMLLAKGPSRVKVLGWMCVGFAVSVFAAPLSIIKQVVRTKSVEFMPFSLSFFLTLSAIVWFFYGLLIKDIFVAIPNILGFIFGVLQMVLYIIYKDAKVVVVLNQDKLPGHVVSIRKMNSIRKINSMRKTNSIRKMNSIRKINETKIVPQASKENSEGEGNGIETRPV